MWFSDWVAARTVGDSTEGLVLLTLDWRVLSWAFGACLFTALAFGMAPALFALRLDLNSTLKSGARGTIGDRGHQRFRHVLIVGQFALAMVLLAGAALVSPHVVLGSPVRFLSLCTRAGVREKVSECETGS